MRRITDEDRFRALLSMSYRLVGLRWTPPAIDLVILPYRRYFDDSIISSADFFSCLRELCRYSGDKSFALVVVDPDRFHEPSALGYHPALEFDRSDTSDQWRATLREGIEFVVSSIQLAVFPDSLAWYATFNAEIALLMSPIEILATLEGYSLEFVSGLLERYEEHGYDTSIWRLADVVRPGSRPWRARIVAIARAMLEGEVELVKGVRQLAGLAHWVPEQPEFERIAAVGRATSALPLGERRNQWSAEYLNKVDAQMNSYLAGVRDELLRDCRRIVERLSDVVD